MKNLIFATSLLLLTAQVNAQQQPTAPDIPIPAPKVNVTTHSFNKVGTSEVHSSVYVVKNQSHPVTANDNGNSYTSNDQDQSDDPVKTKTFSKSFAVDKSDKINLSNIYGSITIKTWAKNEIKVDADMKAFANTDAEAQDLLDKASIVASKEGDDVTFRTKIEETSRNWGIGSKNGKKWRRELKIYMVVYLPANNPLTAAQQYGNLLLDDYAGPTSLKVQYGNLTAGDLTNANNYIAIQYGKGVLQNVNAARIKHQYGGGLKIGNMNDLELDAQYTGVEIGNVKNNAQIKHQYGRGTTIASAGSLSFTAQYASVTVGRLSGTLTGKIQYGKLSVESVEPGCKIFNVDSEYGAVTVGFAANYHAEFDVNTSYGSFKYGSNVTAKRNGGEDRGYSSSKSYSGQIGNGGPNKINIKVDYNSVTFK